MVTGYRELGNGITSPRSRNGTVDFDRPASLVSAQPPINGAAPDYIGCAGCLKCELRISSAV